MGRYYRRWLNIAGIALLVAIMMGLIAQFPTFAAAEDIPTVVPFTESPTAELPTTELPPAEAPTAEAPTTEAPTAEVPPTEAPTVEAPTMEQATAEAPTAEVPPTEAPTVEAPTMEQATAEAPTAEVQPTEAPTAEVPTAETPTVVQPTAEIPTAEPAVVKPTVPQFYRAISLNSQPLAIDGQNWEGRDASGYSVKGNRFCNQSIALKPPTDPARATMIRCSVWGSAVTITLNDLPAGAYNVYLYTWEDNSNTTFDIRLQDNIVQSRYSSGKAGTWQRLGPWPVTISDGTMVLKTAGGHANLSGVELWRTDRVASAESTAAPTLVPTAEATIVPTAEATLTPTTEPTAVPATEQANQWQVYEISLQASAAPGGSRNYTDVEVQANFIAPDGTTQTVRGFWDGDAIYRVRFTPTRQGMWSYSITANTGDPGLTRSGAISVGTPTSHGFIRRDPNAPQSFVYDDGTRYFMLGTTYYELVRSAVSDSRWQAAVTNARAAGINKVRLLIYPWGGSDNAAPNFYPDSAPFVANQHDQLDLTYWQALDRVINYFQQQGMVADLIMFTDTDKAFGSQAQDERYVRYILARYAAYPHVIWCLSNEWEYTNRSQTYWNRIGAIVSSEDPWNRGAAPRALSIHSKTGGNDGANFAYFGTGWPSHAVVQFTARNTRFVHGDEWGEFSISKNLGKGMPVVNDEFGYIGEVGYDQTEHRNALWAIVMSGGYATTGDKRVFADGPGGAKGRVIRTAIWHDSPEYSDIRHLTDFWTTRALPYWQMNPRRDLVGNAARVYVLAGAQDYVVYAAAGGTFTLKLPAGSFSVTLFNPRTGETSALSNIMGTTSFRLPTNADWVLHVHALK